MQESIIQYSGIYEEMEVFNDKFYVEPSLDSKEFPERRNIKRSLEISFTLSGAAMLGCQCSNQFFNNITFNR